MYIHAYILYWSQFACQASSIDFSFIITGNSKVASKHNIILVLEQLKCQNETIRVQRVEHGSIHTREA